MTLTGLTTEHGIKQTAGPTGLRAARRPRPAQGYYNALEAASYLGVSRAIFRRLEREGRGLPKLQALGGRAIRYSKVALDEFMLQSAVK